VFPGQSTKEMTATQGISQNTEEGLFSVCVLGMASSALDWALLQNLCSQIKLSSIFSPTSDYQEGKEAAQQSPASDLSTYQN
jgi:hypothetical protein